MFCNKCGNQVGPNEKFCNKCGNPLGVLQNFQVNQTVTTNTTSFNNVNYNTQYANYNAQNNIQYTQGNTNNSNNKKMILIGASIGLGLILIVLLVLFFNGNNEEEYYFNEVPEEKTDDVVLITGSATKKGKYGTVIIYDNTYTGVKVSNDSEAISLIVKDSENQKGSCPKDIKEIENDIIKKYSITAVNLCEMDPDFAREIGNVFKKIYDEYPSVRGYITNLTLVNTNMANNYIAAFMPVFTFAYSGTETTYPWVIKTQVLLNTSYFLNKDRLEASVTDGSKSGHFPKNATIYSPVAHELGHYLSFLAMMKNHNMDSLLLVDESEINKLYTVYDDFAKGNYSLDMINEAYERYKKDTNSNITLDEWRKTISNYALAKDEKGNYIYDETIAESFHDVYLNGDKASTASKYVVAVLKERLEK